MNDASNTSDFTAAILSPRPSARVRLAVYASFAVVMAASVWRTVDLLHDPAVGSRETPGMFDFHNGVYHPAVAFRQGVSPYGQAYADGFPVSGPLPLYSPALLWLHYPFALLPLELANVAYYLCSLALMFALAASILHVCRVPLTRVHVLGLVTLLLLSRPGHVNLLQGQITLPIVLSALWAMELARRRPMLAGVALAFTTLKPTFCIPIMWLLVCRRDWRAMAVGVLIGAASIVAGAAPLVARYGLRPFVESVVESQSRHGQDEITLPTTSWTRIDALSVVGRLTQTNPEGIALAVVAAATLLAAGWAVYCTSDRAESDGADSLSGLIIATATLACVYHAMYDALILALPWVGVTCGRLREQLPPWSRPIVWALLALPAVNYLSTRLVIEWLGIEGAAWTAITSANGLAIVAAFLLSAGVAIHRRRQERILAPSLEPLSLPS